MIRFEKVSKVFRGSSGTVKALDDVSLWVPEGSIYGVIGSSGAGKSTLIRCANILERPTAGRVVVDGRDLVRLSPADLRSARRDIGMIFQHFNLLANSTVYENIALPLKLAGEKAAGIEEAITPLLELVGLEDKRNSYPSQLSGGQKQRVAIARALACEPKVLLCDEATSALDPQTTVSILNLLRDINRKLGLTILLITHEMDVVKSICDQVAILSRGRVVEHNDVESFFFNPRTELAREFVRAAVHEKPIEDLPAGIQKEQTEGSHPVLHITFLGNSAVQPLITQAAREFHLDFNIIQADMETVHGKTMGFLTVEVIGDELNTKSVQAFLIKHDLQVEVAGYVS